MQNKISLKEFRKKDKELLISSKKIDKENDIYEATFIFDKKAEVKLSNIPGQWVKEDGKAYDPKKDKLSEEDQANLVNRRIDSLLAQLQQTIFTIEFYGGSIEGFVSKKEEDGKK